MPSKKDHVRIASISNIPIRTRRTPAFFDRVSLFSQYLEKDEALEMARFEILLNPIKLTGKEKERYEELKEKIKKEFNRQHRR